MGEVLPFVPQDPDQKQNRITNNMTALNSQISASARIAKRRALKAVSEIEHYDELRDFVSSVAWKIVLAVSAVVFFLAMSFRMESMLGAYDYSNSASVVSLALLDGAIYGIIFSVFSALLTVLGIGAAHEVIQRRCDQAIDRKLAAEDRYWCLTGTYPETFDANERIYHHKG